MTTPLYSCVKLTDSSKENLLQYAVKKDHLHDKAYAHHMTIQFKKGLDVSNLPLGETVQLQVTGYAQDELVQCVRLDVLHEDIKVTNKHPHVTVSVSENGKPKLSNELLDKGFLQVQDGPVLEGIVGYYTTKNEFKTKEE
ncbi:hypothetical protein CMI41_01930 [Candidatus Pacearchaeota archaeon]|jgi:autonomous glycyl radical cofactor GrcA|nr:hypothetical protein [Candidatus Pacearchaeota archaeon]|tara:strand:- start:4891 stop:5310 length:420 start_codon:yes stop_codon:yes gene_type:complete